MGQRIQILAVGSLNIVGQFHRVDLIKAKGDHTDAELRIGGVNNGFHKGIHLRLILVAAVGSVHHQDHFIFRIGNIISNIEACKDQDAQRHDDGMQDHGCDTVSGTSVSLVQTEIRDQSQRQCRDHQQQYQGSIKIYTEISHCNPLLKSTLSAAGSIHRTAARTMPGQNRRSGPYPRPRIHPQRWDSPGCLPPA